MNNMPRFKKPFSGEHARCYDQMADQAGWLDPDILFGMAFRYVSPGETLLDVGIGTGLASILFHRAGLEVIGVDRAAEMLTQCRQKGFATDLFEHDLTVSPYPLSDDSVHHAVCSGLLHVFEDLSLIFAEVGRVVATGGIFVFVVPHSDEEAGDKWLMNTRSGHPPVPMYRHSLSSISSVAENAGFEMINSLRYASSAIGRQEMEYRACVVRRS